jgi:DNA polymerase III epsilon subunit-like protein
MKIFVFDTETTGLPTERNAQAIATKKWPYIVQLSYILYDTDEHVVVDYSDNIIKLPENVKITPGSQNIHNISGEMSQTKGVEINPLLIEFNKTILLADVIIAHNISFDKNMIMVECYRNDITQNFIGNKIKGKQFCTMKNSINICKIVKHNKYGNQYYKYPKLLELYQILFDETPKGLHNSMVDILACLRCYGKMELDLDFNETSQTLLMLNNMYS